MGRVLSVMRNPVDAPVMQPNGKWNVHGVRDDVDVVVIVHSDGSMVTAYPEPGGRGVVENPEE